MTNEIQTHDAAHKYIVDLSEPQKELLKRTICKGASDDELELFLYVCKHTGLDPFARQIHFVPRKAKQPDGSYKKQFTPQTGIDGFRLVSERTKKYLGETTVYWFDKEGKKYELWTLDENPYACEAGVLKLDPITGAKIESRAIVYWDAVVQTYKDGSEKALPTTFWIGKKGVQQLAKCAKAAAHRMAFPQELSGVYLDGEIPEPDEVDIKMAETSEKHQDIKEFIEKMPPDVLELVRGSGHNTVAKMKQLVLEVGQDYDKIRSYCKGEAVVVNEPVKEKTKEEMDAAVDNAFAEGKK